MAGFPRSRSGTRRLREREGIESWSWGFVGVLGSGENHGGRRHHRGNQGHGQAPEAVVGRFGEEVLPDWTARHQDVEPKADANREGHLSRKSMNLSAAFFS